MYYGFEYFCGANVTVRLGNLVLLEAAGISYDYNNSKRPIYGYSSVHYDAVANGQALVTGTIIVNYVHEDYLFRLIEMHKGVPGPAAVDTHETASDSETESAFISDQENAFSDNSAFADAKRDKYWRRQGQKLKSQFHNTVSPVDLRDGVEIKIIFGDQDLSLNSNGFTGVLLEDVRFTGESKVIRISEDTVVEAYPFFARNRYSIRNTNNVTVTSDPLATSPGSATVVTAN